MKTQLFTFLSFVLSFAVLGEVKVQKAPLKRLLIDNASVVTDVTGTDAAKRLEADGGKSWIDGDGRVYRVERKASFRGLSAVSADDPNAGTVNWSFDYPGAEYCDLSYDPPSRWYLSYGRMEDVENDGVISQEEVQYVYEGTAPWSASSVTMKREHYNDEFVLSLAFVTNAADRLATTGEVARIASGLGGGLTTNDVCSIVTNEVAGGWMFESDYSGLDLTKLEMRWSPYGEDMPGWCLFYKGEHISGVPKGKITDTVFVVQNDWMYGPTYKCTATRGSSRNALGLAMAKDVEKKFAEATNAILSIVTNEVDEGFTEWKFSGEMGDKVVQMTPFWLDDVWWIEASFSGSGGTTLQAPETEENTLRLTVSSSWTGVHGVFTRERIAKNALGLAMAEDLEKLPDHETVTNVARSVVNSVWDASLGVAWEARMHNGHLYYIAVTNRPPEGK